MACSKMAAVGRSVLGTKRALFGPVDHGSIKEALSNQRKMLDDANRKRWNFDFVKESPLSGNFQWTKMSAISEVPEAYEMPHLLQPIEPQPSNGSPRGSNCPDISGRLILTARRRSARLSPKADSPKQLFKTSPFAVAADCHGNERLRRSPRTSPLPPPPPSPLATEEEEFGHVKLPSAPSAGGRRTSVCHRRLTVGGGPITRRASLLLPSNLTQNTITVDFATESKRKQKQARLPEKMSVVKQQKMTSKASRRQTMGGHCCELSRQLASLDKENCPQNTQKKSSPNWGKKRRLSTLHAMDSPGKRTKSFNKRHSLDATLRATPARAARCK